MTDKRLPTSAQMQREKVMGEAGLRAKIEAGAAMTEHPTNALNEYEHCAICLKEFVGGFFACDETMLAYCDSCWPAVECEKKHGEGCATKVWI